MGIVQDLFFWIIGVLMLMGIVVGLVICFSQGYVGLDFVCELLIGVLVLFFVLSGFIVVLIFGFVGGVSLGLEYLIMIVNIVFVVVIGVCLLLCVN